MAPSGTPFLGGLIIQIKAKRAPKRAHFWALRRGLREPPGGAPGAPRAPGPGGAPGAPAPARAPPRGRPPGGVPEGGPGGGLRQGSQTGVSATCNDCPVSTIRVASLACGASVVVSSARPLAPCATRHVVQLRDVTLCLG